MNPESVAALVSALNTRDNALKAWLQAQSEVDKVMLQAILNQPVGVKSEEKKAVTVETKVPAVRVVSVSDKRFQEPTKAASVAYKAVAPKTPAMEAAQGAKVAPKAVVAGKDPLGKWTLRKGQYRRDCFRLYGTESRGWILAMDCGADGYQVQAKRDACPVGVAMGWADLALGDERL